MAHRPLRHVYRDLLRAASASVWFSRPAARSVRKLLREDVEAAGPSAYAVCAERTLAFLLLSSVHAHPRHGPVPEGADAWQPSSTSEAAHLAHRCIANLASLTYHHLSPNTPMRRTRVGGSSRSTAPRKMSAVSEAYASIDEVAGADSASPGVPLDVLRVPPKPVRGPVGTKPVYWDAQHPEKHLLVADGDREMHALQTHLDSLVAKHTALLEQHGAEHKSVKQAKTAMVDLRGTLKGMRRAEANRAAEKALAQRPKHLLHALVQRAAHSENLWLGMPRWARWERGEFLAP